MYIVKDLNATFKFFERKFSNEFECQNSFSFLYEQTVTCKRDPEARDRADTETFDLYDRDRERDFHRDQLVETRKCVSRPSQDRYVETEYGRPTSLHATLHVCLYDCKLLTGCYTCTAFCMRHANVRQLVAVINNLPIYCIQLRFHSRLFLILD